METNDTLLDVENLRTMLDTKLGEIYPVDGISFKLKYNETLGLVGESGSGKSMTANSLVQLIPRPAGKIVEGSIKFEGEDLVGKSEKEMRMIRGRKIGMILQDPQSSLNPLLKIGYQVKESLIVGGKISSKTELYEKAIQKLRQVQLADPENRISSYPHQLSGGMKQRVVGAIAISSEPKILIADEPTTALDVTIQAQYLRLMNQIKEDTGLSILFITHDFGIVAEMCDRVAVMYAGRIVETGTVEEFFKNPAHPYTEALIKSVPSPEEKVDRLFSIKGNPPALWNLPIGCRYAPRCSYAKERCFKEYPLTRSINKKGEEEHSVACWLDRSEF